MLLLKRKIQPSPGGQFAGMSVKKSHYLEKFPGNGSISKFPNNPMNDTFIFDDQFPDPE
jgi:hypothetical protein